MWERLHCLSLQRISLFLFPLTLALSILFLHYTSFKAFSSLQPITQKTILTSMFRSLSRLLYLLENKWHVILNQILVTNFGTATFWMVTVVGARVAFCHLRSGVQYKLIEWLCEQIKAKSVFQRKARTQRLSSAKPLCPSSPPSENYPSVKWWSLSQKNILILANDLAAWLSRSLDDPFECWPVSALILWTG